MHGRPVALLGGVAVYLAFAFTTLVFVRPIIREQVTLLLAGAAVFAVIGLVDDLRNTGAWKLVVEGIVVVAIVWLGGFRVVFPWPYLGEILAILWILGVANAMNCLDCSDGVAAGTVVISALALTLLAVLGHRWAVAVSTVAVAGAALGFVRYNFPPARIFLGDAGSLMLGFLLAALGATLTISSSSLPAMLAPVLVLSIPCCDFLLVHWRRYRQGVSLPAILTSTGKDHLPHRLLDMGLSHRQVAWWLYGSTALLGASAIVLVLSGPLAAALLMTPLVVVVAAAVGGWGAGGSPQGRAGLADPRPAGHGEGLAPREVPSKI